jgi:glucose-6-phosphate 1-dehydrogenase
MAEKLADAFVFFGATGDLAYKKIFPALQRLMRRGRLDMPIVGVAREGWTLERLLERAKASLIEYGDGLDEEAFAKFSKQLRYVEGDYHELRTFQRLREALGSAEHPLHYLAIPPSMFPKVIELLDASGSGRGSRIIVEKPFGRDLASAEELNRIIAASFPEPSVFRIDHYLGKEAVQNLIVLRFANTFFEPIWNRNYIESIQITMAETFGVQGRGKFFEEVGTLRDVVQNHIMQVVAFLAMEPPLLGYDESTRDEVVKVFRAVKPLQPKDVIRGQFKGYLNEAGVAKDSFVETFVALRLEIETWRWAGVPFFIRAGKSLPVTATEVVVKFKSPPLSGLCPGSGNALRLRLNPDLNISLEAQVKKPGTEMIAETATLTLVERQRGQGAGAYERLIGDALIGDTELFARKDAVEAAWSVFEDVLRPTTAPEVYEPGSWGPGAAAALAAGCGGWSDPKA